MMTVGSLFAGIGGFDLGLERAGMRVKWQVEIDGYCQRVLAKHWPAVRRYGDIKSIDWAGVEPVDVICGGFPCQPFSLAGKRKGQKDDRYLWPEMLRAIAQVRPTWVIAENVPGLIGAGLDTVLFDLEAAGYSTATLSVPACAVGANHIRQRLWVLGYADSNGEPVSAIHAEASRVQGDVAHAERDGDRGKIDSCETGGQNAERPAGRARRPSDGSRAADVADTDTARCTDVQGGHAVARSNGRRAAGDSGWWDVEPNVGRVAHGVPKRVDRLRGLGNAVVPQVVEWIGRRIVDVSTR